MSTETLEQAKSTEALEQTVETEHRDPGGDRRGSGAEARSTEACSEAEHEDSEAKLEAQGEAWRKTH